MSIKNHAIMFLSCFLAWLIFYLIGYPSNYFMEWDLAEKVLLTLVGFFALFPFLGCVILLFLRGNFFKNSFYFAFYGSIPLFIFDFIVVGILQKHGFSFLTSHWYLTIGYMEAWIIFPIIGWALSVVTNSSFSVREKHHGSDAIDGRR
jgi:hypothetical protein